MGSHINFKNFGDAPPGEGKPLGNYSLARQSSVYSLTFDEFQNTMGGFGKDFGSMNMDELLKNIWTAEEIQGMTCTVGGGEGSVHGGNLQRQGSLTLPRTLSQKTVDEVWKDLIKESSDGGGGGAKVGNGNANGVSNANVPQRQPTLGEVTLEEFLVRAGVVREDTQPTVRPTNSVFYGELPRPNNNSGLTFEFQQSNRSNGVLGNRIMENNNSVPIQPPSLAMNVGGLRSSQQQIQQLQQQQSLFPKPTTVPFASPVQLVNNAQIANPGSRGSVVGVAEPSMNTALVQRGGIGMVGLAPGVVTSIAGSPVSQISSEAKSSIDTSSLSPVPYVFSRGRKCGGALEKVVERRQRRMIKNRESAARSRARKQAYTLELEAEVAKLKEMNQELQRKQEEIMEMEKNQKLETMNRQWGGCGFVKYSHRDMAMAAINALNGIYTMRGCDQPLTVRFADPTRPRPGDSRGGPALGGPGLGPQFRTLGPRPSQNFGDPMGDRIPPNAWHPMSPPNVRPPSNTDFRGFGGQFPSRSRDMALPLNPGGCSSGFGGPPDGSLVGQAVTSSSTSQQSFNQSKPQVPPVSQQMPPFQKPMQSPQHLPPSLQSHPQTPASYSQMQTPLASLQQLGQPQLPHSAGQTPFSQALPSQHLLGLGGQFSVSQPQVQQTASSATTLQTPLDVNLQPHSVSTVTNQQQLPAPVPQQLQHLQQPPSQLAQMLSQQTQTLQASFQSSQQAFSQLQQQLQLMQPSNQQQSSQPNKQQQTTGLSGALP